MPAVGFPGDGGVVIVVGTFGQFGDQFIDAFDGEVFVEHIVDEHDGGGTAGAEAFELNESESPIRGGFALLDLEGLAQVIGELAGVADFAREGSAHLQEEFALGLEPVILRRT